MPEKFNEFGGYSIDYRETGTVNKIKNRPITQSVIGNGIKEYEKVTKETIVENNDVKVLDTEIKVQEEKNESPEIKEIYLDLKSEKRVRIKMLIISFIILLLAFVTFFILYLNIDRTVSKECISSGILSSLPLCESQENIIYPGVLANLDAFDKISDVEPKQILSAGIWKLILEQGTEKYNNFDTDGFSLIPKKDVENSIYELFGEECEVDFSNKIDGDFFTYLPEDDNFHIAPMSNRESYFPYIRKSRKEDDSIILEVGYVSPYDNWLKKDEKKSAEPFPAKYVEYNLKKNHRNSKYYIYFCRKIC